MLLFGDDRVVSYTGDNLQKAACKLNQIIMGHVLTVSVERTKLIAFKGRDPVRSETVRR